MLVSSNKNKLFLAIAALTFCTVGCGGPDLRQQGLDAQNNDSPFEDSQTATQPQAPNSELQELDTGAIAEACTQDLNGLPGKSDKKLLSQACQRVKVLPSCQSHNGHPIYHYDKIGKNLQNSKRILALSLIHGDEVASGSVSRSWMSRLERLNPRNTWRVIPVVNPDGLKIRTRTNARKVDVNRNFPTEDWEKLALNYWRTKKKSAPRRYPGPFASSENETKCLVDHFLDFDPHFIISVHTPLGVLDFDGPKSLKFPKFSPLPWISLGNYPGSLGRYMWVDRQVPVLTIELKGSRGVEKLARFDRLQDISGTVAIQSYRRLNNSKQAQRQQEEKAKKQ